MTLRQLINRLSLIDPGSLNVVIYNRKEDIFYDIVDVNINEHNDVELRLNSK